MDASDIAQQTLLDAWRGLHGFRGTTSAELLAWLKQIVVPNAIDNVRRHTLAEKRCVHREMPLMAESSGDAQRPWDVPGLEESPSQRAKKAEEELLLADAMGLLPPDYQTVLLYRSLLRLPFSDVAQRMNRSRPAVQMLWARAVEQLRSQLGSPIHPASLPVQSTA